MVTFTTRLAVMLSAVLISTTVLADKLDELRAKGTIVVGTYVDPPETWQDLVTGEWKGIDADITRAIGTRLGLKVVSKIIPHSAIAPSLEIDDIDVMAALYLTPDRQKKLRFNTVPMWYGNDVIVARRSGEIRTIQDLKGKSVATIRGGAQASVAPKLAAEFGFAEIKHFDQIDLMLKDVESGRTDAALWFGFTFDYAMQQTPNRDLRLVQVISPAYYGLKTLPANWYAFKQRETETLVEAFDRALQDIRDTGGLKKILTKYGLNDDSYVTGEPK